jgi:hypothetical protein
MPISLRFRLTAGCLRFACRLETFVSQAPNDVQATKKTAQLCAKGFCLAAMLLDFESLDRKLSKRSGGLFRNSVGSCAICSKSILLVGSAAQIPLAELDFRQI